jgi:hypothetical protein
LQRQLKIWLFIDRMHWIFVILRFHMLVHGWRIFHRLYMIILHVLNFSCIILLCLQNNRGKRNMSNGINWVLLLCHYLPIWQINSLPDNVDINGLVMLIRSWRSWKLNLMYIWRIICLHKTYWMPSLMQIRKYWLLNPNST